MPGSMPPLDLSRQLADALKRIQRLERASAAPGGFNASADPIVIGSGASTDSQGGEIAIGRSAATTSSSGNGDSIAIGDGATSDDGIAIGDGSSVAGTHAHGVAIGKGASTAGPSSEQLALGAGASANNDSATAVGGNSYVAAVGGGAFGNSATATHDYSTALGYNAQTAKNHQIMLGTSSEFVEIPGNGTANGLVLTDTATGTRYLIQITSGALVLSTAP